MGRLPAARQALTLLRALQSGIFASLSLALDGPLSLTAQNCEQPIWLKQESQDIALFVKCAVSMAQTFFAQNLWRKT
jgi:hypothetical protein